MFHHMSPRNSFILGQSQRSRSQGTKKLYRRFLHSCECRCPGITPPTEKSPRGICTSKFRPIQDLYREKFSGGKYFPVKIFDRRISNPPSVPRHDSLSHHYNIAPSRGEFSLFLYVTRDHTELRACCSTDVIKSPPVLSDSVLPYEPTIYSFNCECDYD